MTYVWIAVGLVLGIAGYLYLSRFRKKREKASPAALMKRLVKLTHDPEVARRLISGERSRQPNLSEVAILKRVIRRLERDRRR